MRDGLRLLDLGWVSGLRSQTVWHAVAERTTPDDRATLCLCSPTDAYVSIGYHRRLDEIDLAACEQRGLPVYRRRVGGGPVYCDGSQLFFQLIVPERGWPAMMDRAWERAMGPAVDAFRAMGVKAELTEANDLVAEGRKISGTGAARIGDALVFVGNVIFDFDHDAMADILALSAGAKKEAARLMRRYLAPVHEAANREVDRAEAVRELIDSYAAAFGIPRRSTLTDDEVDAARALDERFADRAWVGSDRPPVSPRIKIRAGVSLLLLGSSWVSVVDGVIEGAGLTNGWVPAPGMRATLQRALAGTAVERDALAAAVTGACGTWDKGEQLVEAIIGAYRGGA